MAELEFGHHIAKGAFGDLFYGTYHSMEVAIKQIREDAGSPQCYQEFLQVFLIYMSYMLYSKGNWKWQCVCFVLSTQLRPFVAQEVAMMRKARHKHIVQMIGAHMAPDRKLIVFEYMSGGSVHDWIRRVSMGFLGSMVQTSNSSASGQSWVVMDKLQSAVCAKYVDFT